MHSKINTIIKKDLVLLGAGHANIEVLRKMGMKPLKGLRVTLITNQIEATYSGMVPAYVAGEYDWSDINIDLLQLCNKFEIRLIVATALKIDRTRNLIFLKGRPPIEFDYLSVNVGIKTKTNDIKGSDTNALRLKPIARIKNSIEKLIRYNQRNINNNVVIIGTGAAGVEVALALRSRFAYLGIKKKITLMSKDSKILKNYNKFAQKQCEYELIKNNIKIIYNTKINKIEEDYILYNKNKKIICTYPILATSSSPTKLILNSNLPLNKNGSIIINNKLQVKNTENIFAAGDNSEIIDFKTEKAGVYAVKQSKVLYKNICNKYLKKTLHKYYPQKTYLSLLGVPKKRALAIKSFFSIKLTIFWHLKQKIDKRFISRYNSNKKEFSINTSSINPYEYDMQCKGCGNKLAKLVLEKAFKSNIKNGSLDAEKIEGTKNLYATTDVISSIVSDPYKLGIISAKHALNDIYASNSTPLSSQMIISLPPALNEINTRDLIQVKKGAEISMKNANCRITGGHSYNSNDNQIYSGFSIIGKKKQPYIKTKKKYQGKLYMSGKIGSAIIFSAIAQNILKGTYSEQVVNEMTNSNYDLFKILNKNRVDCITDISGFGLGAHAYNLLLRNKKLKGLEINLHRIPLYEGVIKALKNNVKSSLNEANKHSLKGYLHYMHKETNILNILFDPQTAGGFLFIISQNESQLIKDLKDKKLNITCIGKTIDNNRKIRIV